MNIWKFLKYCELFVLITQNYLYFIVITTISFKMLKFPTNKLGLQLR